MSDTLEIIGRVAPGQLYRRHFTAVVVRDGQRFTEDVGAGLYRMVAFATDHRTRQERVLCRGLDGPDRGRLIVCSLHEFASGFREEGGVGQNGGPPQDCATPNTHDFPGINAAAGTNAAEPAKVYQPPAERVAGVFHAGRGA